jgi:nucleoside-diphosphate-sugar epimerase
MTEAVLDGAAEAGAKLVFADNLYMYGPPDGPMTEETPQRAEGRKGRMRIEMADAVLRAHADGRLRSTIGRSSDYYGPRGTGTTAGTNIMRPALRGKRTRWLGSLDQLHTLNYLEDMGRALATLGERDEADGQSRVKPGETWPTSGARQHLVRKGSRSRRRCVAAVGQTDAQKRGQR